MNSRQLIALAGAMTLLVGVFGPIVSIPILGTMNYFQNGRGDGAFILLLAVASAVFAFNKRFGYLWWTASGSMGVMLFTFFRFQSVFSSFKKDIESTLEGNLFRGLAEAAVGGVQLGWGWAVLLIGVALLFMAAAMKEAGAAGVIDLWHEQASSVPNANLRQCPHCAELVRAEAKICRFCHRNLPPLTAPPEQAAAVHDGSGTCVPRDGVCPNCDKVVDMASTKCPHCGASFGPSSAWKIQPLSRTRRDRTARVILL